MSSSESGYSSDECRIRSPSNLIIKKDERKFQRNFEVTDLLTESANGVLYNGFNLRSGKPVVIKQIPRNVIGQYFNVNGRMCPSEIYFHLKASKVCQTVVKPIAWFERRSSFVLVMEKFENAIDLFDFSRTYGAIKEEPAKVIFNQIARCAAELHRAGIVHRDYKDENVLINPRTLEVKVIDFGCATEIAESYFNPAGTLEYFPPEWFSRSEMSAVGLTVWSLGSILYILLAGCWEFENGTHRRDFISERNLSQSALALLNSVLCPFASKRASLDSILSSQWFSNIL